MADTDRRSLSSSPCCCFRLFRPSNPKINSISPQQDQVPGPTEQSSGRKQDDPVLQVTDSQAKNQSQEDEELDRLRSGIRRLNEDLNWLFSDSYVNPWSRQTIADNLSQTKTGASPNKKDPQYVVRDITGARASPVELLPLLSFSSSYGETSPPNPPRRRSSAGGTDGLSMTYTDVFLLSDAKETAHNVKKECDPILQESNSPDDQEFRQKKEETKEYEQVEALKKATVEVSDEGKTEQTVPKEEYDRVLREMISLTNQLSQIRDEIETLKQITEKQEQKSSFQVENSSREEESMPAACSTIRRILYEKGEKAVVMCVNPLPAFLVICVMGFVRYVLG